MTAIQIQDRMSAPLRRMTNAMNIIISSFEQMEHSSQNAIDRASLQAARRELTGAEADFRNIEEQIRNNMEAQDRFNQSIHEGSNMTERFKNTYDKIGGAVAALGVGVGAGAIFESVNNRQQALNSYQAQTGVDSGAMPSIEQSMKNLYMDNMGESFDDIANSMATITQITGQMGSQLETTTNNALLMRDTFQYDVTESIRAADMMQRQFGITGAQAYDQIIQATQAGLNKNDDLLDTINEYSVHFRQLGFNSGQMFNMLINGAKSGTFSVDKLGDAVKEFSIRAIDGSDTTKQGFKAIGLDANRMAAQFSQGGLAAQQAFQQTINALESIKNPIAQNTAGVNLFGTMWEDLGAKGVFALGNVNGGITTTVQNLQALNNQRYDDAGSALASLGRTINVQLTDAVGGAVNNVKIAILNFTNGIQGDLSNVQGMFGYLGYGIQAVGGFFVDNWSTIAPLILGVAMALGVYGTYLAATNTIEGISKAIKIASTMATFASTVARKGEITNIMKETAAQLGLNAAMLACPITWIVAGIIAIIAVIYLAVAAFNKIANTSISATGIVCGVFAVAGAIIANLVIGLINQFIGWGVELYNLLGTFANFFANVFNDPVGAIIKLFAGVFDYIVGIVQSAAGLIDTLLGSDISGAIAGFRDNFNASVDDIVGKQNVVIERAKSKDYQIERVKYSDAWKAGNNFGEGIEKSVKGIFKKDKKPTDVYDNQQYKDPYNSPATQSNNVPSDVENIKKNTKKSADAIKKTNEELRYIRDFAARRSIDRYTTANINVSLTNNNTINKDLDIDGVVNKVNKKMLKEINERWSASLG